MNKTRYVLLGLLAERPYSGYELKQTVEFRFALFWKESYGQIYPELKRLEREELVTSRVEGPRGKTTYTLTGQGLHALQTWLTDEADDDQVRSELLLKLYFSAFCPPEVRLQHVRTVKKRAEIQLGWLEESERQLQALLTEDATHPHALSVVRLGLATQKAQRTWAQEELSRVPGAKPSEP